MATPIPRNRARFTGAELAFATGGTLLAGAADARCVGVSIDTRTLAAGARAGGRRKTRRLHSTVIQASRTTPRAPTRNELS